MEYLTTQIVKAVLDKDITLKEVANQVGIARPTVWRKLKRPELWRAGELKKLATILDITFTITK